MKLFLLSIWLALPLAAMAGTEVTWPSLTIKGDSILVNTVNCVTDTSVSDHPMCGKPYQTVLVDHAKAQAALAIIEAAKNNGARVVKGHR